ncbi:MAG: MFS transporter [Limnochordaceae bacterium]|nr:MFS transporter [Limnochordaceae bacterium]
MLRSRRANATMAVLRQPAYRRVWLAQVVSQFGDALTEIALIYYVATLSRDPLLISLVIFAMLLPTALVGPFAGVVADRSSQRRIMILADLARMVVVAAMVPAALAGHLPLLLGLVFLEGVGTSFFGPARAAIIPKVVGAEHVAEAISVSQATTAIIGVLGPAAGGVLLGLTQPVYAFVIDMATFAVSALLLASVQVAPVTLAPTAGAGAGYFQALRTGLRTLGHNSRLTFLLGILVFFSLIFGVVNTTFNAVLLQEFRLGPGAFGGIQASNGVGAVLGSVLAPLAIRLLGGTVMLLSGTGLLGLVIASVGLVGQMVAGGYAWATYPWALMLGAATAAVSVASSTLVMTLTPAQVLGRIAALMQAGTNAANIAGILAGGGIAAALGSLRTTVGAGLATAVMALLSLAASGFRALRQQEAQLRATQPEGQAAGHVAEAGDAATVAVAASLRGVPMREAMVVREAVQWQWFASAWSVRVLALLEKHPATPRELASQLQAPEPVVERHLAGLARAGLVAASGPGGAYRLVARDVRVTPDAVGGPEGMERMIARFVQPGVDQLRQMMHAIPPELKGQALARWLADHGYLLRFSAQVLYMSRKQWERLSEQLERSLVELSRYGGAGGDDAEDKAPNGPEEAFVFTLLSFRLPDERLAEEVAPEVTRAPTGRPEPDQAHPSQSHRMPA